MSRGNTYIKIFYINFKLVTTKHLVCTRNQCHTYASAPWIETPIIICLGATGRQRKDACRSPFQVGRQRTSGDLKRINRTRVRVKKWTKKCVCTCAKRCVGGAATPRSRIQYAPTDRTSKWLTDPARELMEVIEIQLDEGQNNCTLPLTSAFTNPGKSTIFVFVHSFLNSLPKATKEKPLSRLVGHGVLLAL